MYLDNEIVYGREVRVEKDEKNVGDIDWVALGAVTPVKD